VHTLMERSLHGDGAGFATWYSRSLNYCTLKRRKTQRHRR
jgi:hypothetical protein